MNRVLNVMAWVSIIAMLLLVAWPVRASESVSWGGTNCRIVATPDQIHVAEITCTNILTGGFVRNFGTIEAGEITATIETEFAPGAAPDTFTATVEDGFVAVPASLTLDENGRGVIRVYAIDGVPLG